MEVNMKWFWTWGGKCFGYRDGDNLWTHNGYHIGKFRGDNVYDRDGRYLGEIKSDNRLITNKSKKNVVSSSFTPHTKRVGYVKYVDYVGYVMYLGYEEFPSWFFHTIFRVIQ
jgi:sporulation protein YlmC with PRC-barrel domain